MSAQVPTNIRSAFRRVQRTPVGKHLDVEEAYPLGDVLPAAWALGAVGMGATHPRPRIAVVVDEDSAGNGLRWYGLIPTLLGAGKSSRVTHLFSRYQSDRDRRCPGTLCALKPPLFALGSVLQLARESSPPSAIVFANADLGSGGLLRELTDPQMAQWLSDGTEILLVADSDVGLLIMMRAIEDLGGEVGPLVMREERFFGGGGSDIGGTSACRLLQAPRAQPGCGTVATQMAAQLDVILETMNEAVEALETDAFTFGVSAPGRSMATELARFMVLPFRFMLADFSARVVGRGDGLTAVIDLDDPDYEVVVPTKQLPPNEFLQRRDKAGVLERYRHALLTYRDHVSPILETITGAYGVDDSGDLIIQEGGPEYADLLDESTWPVRALPASVLDAGSWREVQALGDDSPAAAIAVEKGAQDDASVSGTSSQEPADSSNGAAALLREVDAPVSILPETPRSVLVETIRELQRKLRAAHADLADARTQLASRSDSQNVVPRSSPGPKAQLAGTEAVQPGTWDDLFIWAHRHHSQAIAFTSRARRAARKSVFRDIGHASEAIALLAVEYRNMRLLGDAASREALEGRLLESGLTVGATGLAAASHQTSDLYTATWNGKRYRLDMHVQGSSTRDQTRGLRVYFTWLPEQALILIGHLPTHLRNTLS